MSTLDKFKNHKTAYLLTRNGLIPEYENISEVDIISVGRKYVTITNNVRANDAKNSRPVTQSSMFLILRRLSSIGVSTIFFNFS